MGWIIGWVFYLIWGQGTGQFKIQRLMETVAMGLGSSRDFYPVTSVQGSTPVTLYRAPH